MKVGSKALMTVSIIPNTLQIIWQRCKDVVVHFLRTLPWLSCWVETAVPGGGSFSAADHFSLLNVVVNRPCWHMKDAWTLNMFGAL